MFQKYTGEHPCRGVISINLQSNFIEIAIQRECSPVNLLNILRSPFLKNTSGRLLLFQANWIFQTGDVLFYNLSILQNFSFAKFTKKNAYMEKKAFPQRWFVKNILLKF